MRSPQSRLIMIPTLPPGLQSWLFAAAVNHLLRGQQLREQLGVLDDKIFTLRALDQPVHVTFRLRAGRLQAAAGRTPDVIIRASLRDFVALAMRQEDPDTLFFQRRLSVEGATETGLCMKNVLDGIEYDFDAHCRDVLPRPAANLIMFAWRSFQAVRSGNRRNSRPAAPLA